MSLVPHNHSDAAETSSCDSLFGCDEPGSWGWEVCSWPWLQTAITQGTLTTQLKPVLQTAGFRWFGHSLRVSIFQNGFRLVQCAVQDERHWVTPCWDWDADMINKAMFHNTGGPFPTPPYPLTPVKDNWRVSAEKQVWQFVPIIACAYQVQNPAS